MSMMDWSEFGFEDTKEPFTLPDGTEAQMQILAVSKTTSQKGNTGYSIRMEVEDEPYAKEVFHYLMLPNKDQTEKARNNTKWMFLQFASCFGVDLSSPSSPEDEWAGYEGWCILGIQEDAQYGRRNIIKEFKRRR